VPAAAWPIVRAASRGAPALPTDGEGTLEEEAELQIYLRAAQVHPPRPHGKVSHIPVVGKQISYIDRYFSYHVLKLWRLGTADKMFAK